MCVQFQVFFEKKQLSDVTLQSASMLSVCVPLVVTGIRLDCTFDSVLSFHFLRRGVQSTVETAPNEAIHLCWKQSLISPVYLLDF